MDDLVGDGVDIAADQRHNFVLIFFLGCDSFLAARSWPASFGFIGVVVRAQPGRE